MTVPTGKYYLVDIESIQEFFWFAPEFTGPRKITGIATVCEECKDHWDGVIPIELLKIDYEGGLN